MTDTRLHTTPQAAAYLGLSPNTLNRWRYTGDGPRFVKLGRAVRYRIEDLDEWVASCGRTSTSSSAVMGA
jgi:excisionase family DNA binding protein